MGMVGHGVLSTNVINPAFQASNTVAGPLISNPVQTKQFRLHTSHGGRRTGNPGTHAMRGTVIVGSNFNKNTHGVPTTIADSADIDTVDKPIALF